MKRILTALVLMMLVFVVVGCSKSTTSSTTTTTASTTEGTTTVSTSDSTTTSVDSTTLSDATSNDTTSADDATTTLNTEKITKGTGNVAGTEIGFQIDISSAKLVYDLNDPFDSTGVKVYSIADNGVRTLLETGYNVECSSFDSTVSNKYAVTVTYGSYDVETYYVGVIDTWIDISTAAELKELATVPTSDKIDYGSYRLTQDIDCSTVEWTYESGFCHPTFAGILDGQGYTIKNLNQVAAEAKVGVLFADTDNCLIQNIRFDSCSNTSGFETVGLITGLSNGAVYRSIEFSGCDVTTTDNYCGLVFGRNYNTPSIFFLDSITVKNCSSAQASTYGGILTGDILATSKVVASNIDLSGTLTLNSSNGGAILGRDRGSKSMINNVYVRDVEMFGTAKLGLFFDGGAAGNYSVTNVLVKSASITGTQQCDLFMGGKTANTVYNYENCFYVSEDCICTLNGNATTPTVGTAINRLQYDTASFSSALSFDVTNKWEIVNEDVKLIGTSPNTPSATATLSSIKLITRKASARFFKGEEFSSAGLIVMATYSDGVVIPLSADNYNIVSSYDANTVNTYDISIQPTENNALAQSYTVSVVEITGFRIYDQFVVKTYIQSDTTRFSSDGIAVYGIVSDGTEIELSQSLTSANEGFYIDSTSFVKSTAGIYPIKVTYKDYAEQSFNVTVISPDNLTKTGARVYVRVDADYTGTPGAVVETKTTFKTIKEALDFIDGMIAYEEATSISRIGTNKIYIQIAEGVYNEKLTITKPNINLVGEYVETNVTTSGTHTSYTPVVTISYGAAAGMKDIYGSYYGTEGCATVYVTSTATGFKAANILFENSFDYLNPGSISDKQAVAVKCDADQSTFVRCNFTGNQDTLYTRIGRQYYVNCTIAGSVDFIFGKSATVLFDDCIIHTVYRGAGQGDTNNGYITAYQGTNDGTESTSPEYGYVFSNCRFTADSDVPAETVALARPWGKYSKVAFINCEMGEHISRKAYGESGMNRWEDMSGVAPTTSTVKYVEYNNTGLGSITTAVAGGSIINETTAANYTITNIFATTNGNMTYTDPFDGGLSGYTSRFTEFVG